MRSISVCTGDSDCAYSCLDSGNDVETLVSATWPVSNWVPINMMYHQCRRGCLDCDVTMAFSKSVSIANFLCSNIYFIFKGTSKIHLNFKVGIFICASFLAKIAA